MPTKIITFKIDKLQNGKLLVECGNGKSVVSDDYSVIFNFMIYTTAYSPRAVWNLSDAVAKIKTILTRNIIAELESETHRATWFNEVRFRVFYQPGKFLGINLDHREINFYELDQFFPDEEEPDTINALQSHADRLSYEFASIGAKCFDNLKSPVAVVESSGILKSVYDKMPSPSDIPEGCKEYAALSDTYGAWVSAYQAGYWDKCYSYDMASCYPSIASRLMSLDGAEYKHSKEVLKDARYGFVKGDLYIDTEHESSFRSPIVGPVGDVLGNPVGHIAGVFTIGQVNYVLMHGLGKFEMKDGWFIYPATNRRPLFDIMNLCYLYRDKSPTLSLIAKRVAAGIIGRLGQYINDEPTEYTNPVYHSIIRNSAPLHVDNFLTAYQVSQQELIHVNTDGFHCTRALNIPRDNGMGKWRLDEVESLVVLSPGKIIEGEKCRDIIQSLKDNPSKHEYDGFNFMSLVAEQNRYFPKYPKTGSQLLRNKYMSYPFEV